MYTKILKEMSLTNSTVFSSFYYNYPAVHKQILFKMVYENRLVIGKLFSMDIIDSDQAISLETALTINLSEAFWKEYNAWHSAVRDYEITA